MFLISGPELVIEACKSGIVGAFPTSNARPIGVLEAWMEQIVVSLAEFRQANPDKLVGPWCANLITHTSNQRLPEDLRLVAKYQPPIVVTALGSPKPVIEVVHGYGGLVIADVINLALARKAVAAGVDGLACISAGAGGHTGQLSPFSFVSAVRRFFDGPIAIGGGISDGWGVAGAIAAGADLVYMGTRFIPTHESMAQDAYKQMVVDSTVDDLIISAALTGAPASWLKPSLEANGVDLNNMPAVPERNYDSSKSLDARRWKDIWAAGQGVESIERVESTGHVIAQITHEYRHARERMLALSA
ncbi:NAD(P)H-dependent flavin oxidoreductase [Paracandidimonas lactea]|uniref:NAD(P)H-dependent flavin oxidoreductase n=1 Tax=Paracandidimonas lactea TaxID=2895524 RepID=UPI001EF0DA55|nr:nitronate monooxygenase [Paracandidimonas lactea]